MAQLVDNLREDLGPGLPTLVDVDESAARRALRGQIAKLERDLAGCFATSRGEALALAVPGASGPRLLGLGELERMRDDLAERLHGARAELHRRADQQEANRVLLEKMRLNPRAYKYVRVTSKQLGEGGCWAWDVRPRLGLIGMMMGWWQVKLSSGCPLATGHRSSP